MIGFCLGTSFVGAHWSSGEGVLQRNGRPKREHGQHGAQISQEFMVLSRILTECCAGHCPISHKFLGFSWMFDTFPRNFQYSDCVMFAIYSEVFWCF